MRAAMVSREIRLATPASAKNRPERSTPLAPASPVPTRKAVALPTKATNWTERWRIESSSATWSTTARLPSS